MNKEEKLQRLQEVLNEYEPFLRNYNRISTELKTSNKRLVSKEEGVDGYGEPIIKVYNEKIEPTEFVKISYYGKKNNEVYQAYNVEIPIEDLDITIKRYKEKVNYWKNKQNNLVDSK